MLHRRTESSESRIFTVRSNTYGCIFQRHGRPPSGRCQLIQERRLTAASRDPAACLRMCYRRRHVTQWCRVACRVSHRASSQCKSGTAKAAAAAGYSRLWTPGQAVAGGGSCHQTCSGPAAHRWRHAARLSWRNPLRSAPRPVTHRRLQPPSDSAGDSVAECRVLAGRRCAPDTHAV